MQRSLEAYITGRDAGRLQLVAALNPHDPGSAAFKVWKRGRFAALSDDLRPAYGVIVAVAAGGVLWLAIVAAVYGLVLA
jgi:hypothetical protein